MTALRRLHWGCGPVRPEGWINADLQSGPGIDLSVDITEGLPLESDSIAYAVSHHALQQLDIYAALDALRELERVLEPGGVLRLGLPDLDRAIAALQEGRQAYFWTWEWKSLIGNFVTQITDYGYTRTPMNFDLARELLERAGFGDVALLDHGSTASSQPVIVSLADRPDESFFVEARKVRTTLATPRPGAPRRVRLGWRGDTSRTLSVLWETTSHDNPARVEIRPNGNERWTSRAGSTRRISATGFQHEVELTGLRPDTRYEYRVSADRGAEGDAETAATPTFRTRTAPPPGPADFRFAFLSDTGIAGRPNGNASGTQRLIDALVAERPLFVLGGGDYAYLRGDRRFAEVHEAVDAWLAQMEPLIASAPFLPQYGNHEVSMGEKLRDWWPRFAHPRSPGRSNSYGFDVGDVHFAALFAPQEAIGAEQIVWLEGDLARARAHGARWLVVYQHQPILASGRSHPAATEIARLLGQVCERHAVDLHLSGHDQSYERSYPLRDLATEPAAAVSQGDRYRQGDGVLFAKVSPAGNRSDIGNAFSRFREEASPLIAARNDRSHHFAVVDVSARGELQVRVVAVPDDDAPAHCIDAFSIGARDEEDDR